MAHDVLGQEETTEGLLPGIHLYPITKHGYVHHIGPRIHESNDLVLSGIGQICLDQLKRG